MKKTARGPATLAVATALALAGTPALAGPYLDVGPGYVIGAYPAGTVHLGMDPAGDGFGFRVSVATLLLVNGLSLDAYYRFALSPAVHAFAGGGPLVVITFTLHLFGDSGVTRVYPGARALIGLDGETGQPGLGWFVEATPGLALAYDGPWFAFGVSAGLRFAL